MLGQHQESGVILSVFHNVNIIYRAALVKYYFNNFS